MSGTEENTEESSHKQILRSSAIIGSASIVNIFVGLLRMKAVAVLLGPAGVGLIGIFQNLMNTAAKVSMLGFDQVGTRQIAEAKGRDDQAAVDAARRALFWGTLILACVGALVVWFGNELLAKYVLSDIKHASDVGWVAIGVSLTVATGSQRALLTGMRRIGDIAKLTILSSVFGAFIGVGAVYWLGDRGIVLLVIATPLAGFVTSHIYVNRLPGIQSGPTPIKELSGQWRSLVRLGTAFMVAGVSIMLGQLAVRSMVQQQLGADNLGYFQASWMISMTYIGFILSTMGTDYYPRLSAVIHDKQKANRLVNEQTEVAILLAGPVMLAMIAFAPWIIKLLYTGEFGPAVTILRWQILGDVFKIFCWPLGFLILASGRGSIFMFKEITVISVFVFTTWALIPYLQVEATGVAFFLMYLVNIPLLFIIARLLTGFLWSTGVIRDASILVGLAIVSTALGSYKDWMGAAAGGLFTFTMGLIALYRLSQMTEINGAAAKMIMKLQKLMRK